MKLDDTPTEFNRITNITLDDGTEGYGIACVKDGNISYAELVLTNGETVQTRHVFNRGLVVYPSTSKDHPSSALTRQNIRNYLKRKKIKIPQAFSAVLG